MIVHIRKHILLLAGIIFLLIGSSVMASNRLKNTASVLSERNEISTPTPEVTISPIPTATPKVIIKEVPVYVTTTPLPTAIPQVQAAQPNGYSYLPSQTQSPTTQPTYKQPTASDYSQNFIAVVYGFDLANKCYQQAISQITSGDRTGFNVTLDQCVSIVSPLQSIIHQNVSSETKRVEYNLGTAWGNYNYLFSMMDSLSVSVDYSNADPALDMFKADLKEQDTRYQKAVYYANEAIKEWQAIGQ